MFRNTLRAGLLATTLLAAGWAQAHDVKHHQTSTELKQFGGLDHKQHEILLPTLKRIGRTKHLLRGGAMDKAFRIQ